MKMAKFLIRKSFETVNGLEFEGYNGPVLGRVAAVVNDIIDGYYPHLWPMYGDYEFNPHRLYYIEVVERRGDGVIIYAWNRFRDSRNRGIGGKHDNRLP